ncbi:MAG: hypothetical protein PWP39_902 [Pyrococcus sp.]|uniref:hypothetical protein n=1 Tax=Pyrococcus sp. TaxID=33866 RepID=UPI00258D13F7|nr:hypothetical protein [Pyrococcus sp.]MDK2869667.1 hypothetical protein [Pyrococcus sp.]
MAILGHNIIRIEFEKNPIPGGQVEVSLNPKIEELRLGEINLPNGKVKGIEVELTYNITYSPEVGKGTIKMIVFYLPRNREDVDKILDNWENEKKLPGELVAEVVNFANNLLIPFAMMITKEMGMPSPIPIPRVVVRQ